MLVLSQILKTVMAAPMKNEYIDSLQKLLQLLNEIEKRKSITQKTCKGYQDLFRPCSLEKEKEEKSVGEQTKEDCMSTEVKAELDMVNKLLKRAEKAYKVKEKISEPKRSSELSVSATSCDREPSDIDQPNESKANKHVCKEDQDFKISNSNLVERKTSSIKNSSTLTKQLQESKSNKNSGKPKSKFEVPKPPQKNRQSHISAPFQTNPSIPFPKKSTSITKSAPQHQSSSRYKPATKNTAVKNSQAGLVNKTTSNAAVKDAQTDSVFKKTSNQKTEPCDHQLQEKQRLDTYSPEDKPQEIVDASSSKIDTSEVQPTDNDKGMKKTSVSDIKLTFSLLTEGTKISIPGKLKKLSSTNRKLRQNCEMYKMTKKIEETYSYKIKTVIESDFTDIEEWSLMRNIEDLTNIYRNLHKFLQSLDLQHVSELSAPYDLLRSRKALEMILSTFQHTEDKRSSLNIDCMTNADYLGSCQRKVSPPVKDSYFSVKDPVNGVLFPKRSRVIRYRSCRQLEKYYSLVFQIQYLQFMDNIHHILAEDILPFIKSCHPKSSEFIQLMRSAFSLLTDDTTFPVMVRDTIQELEDNT